MASNVVSIFNISDKIFSNKPDKKLTKEKFSTTYNYGLGTKEIFKDEKVQSSKEDLDELKNEPKVTNNIEDMQEVSTEEVKEEEAKDESDESQS